MATIALPMSPHADQTVGAARAPASQHGRIFHRVDLPDGADEEEEEEEEEYVDELPHTDAAEASRRRHRASPPGTMDLSVFSGPFRLARFFTALGGPD
ncbi:hypothetical protein [Couchioplanes caeruleus]|uniref:Uncharacterized protein n=1 Tax=Couchioplanes caeruleus subsp. caeruleus TaxID=56427 RepID=A0A1K0FKC5_9ACTN|nr:hypothetical protein [Couchioplanes caeruleus]OJF13309.1 hypothetical protein BG844_15975 [Couchioplanes caeruleus subsp. caeruleus]